MSALRRNSNILLKYKFLGTKHWFLDACSNILVDQVYKFEELNQSIDNVCDVLGLDL